MATVTVEIPDQHIPALSAALAREMNVAVPTTGPKRLELFNAWLKAKAKQTLADYLAQEAAQSARGQVSDWQ